MSVKRLVCGVLLSALSVLGLQSCREKVVEVTTFQPKLEILTPSVLGGESFSFRVYSNTGSFIISRLTCGDYDGMTNYDFPFSGINLGSEVKCGDDGWVVFEAKSVKVKTNHEGSISVSLKDPKTGDVCDLEAKYKAFVAFAANGIAIGNENGIVVDGDDFRFSVETNLSYFVLDGFHCPFTTDKLVRNRAYQCDKNGRVDFVIPEVKVLRSARDSIVLDIKDEATGAVIHRSAEFDMRPALTASISVAEVSSNDGTIELFYSASRPNLRIESAVLEREKMLYCGDKEVVSLSDFGFVNEEGLKLSKGSDVKIPLSNLNGDQLSGYSKFTASGVYSDEEQTVSLRLTLYDYETGRTVTASCSFKVRPYSYPDKLKLTLPGGSTKVIDNGGGTEPIPISYYDATAMGMARGQIKLPFTFLTCGGQEIKSPYRYEISLESSSDKKVTFAGMEGAPFTTAINGNATGGNLFIRGGKDAGEATLVVRTVTGKADWDRTYYIRVNVRKRVALVLNASFRQVPEWDREHSFMFDAKSSSINVATWDGPDDLMSLPASRASEAKLSTIAAEGSGMKVTMKTEAYPASYRTKLFEGLCDIGHFKLENGRYYSPGGDIAKYGNEYSYTGNPFYFTLSNLQYGENSGGTEGRDSFSSSSRKAGQGQKRTAPGCLTEYLNHWNDCAMWWTHDKKNKTAYEHLFTEDGYYTFLTRWKEFDISVSDIVYDRSKYDIRYVVYLWGTDMNPDTYWWGTNSSLNVSEVQGMYDFLNYFYGMSVSMDVAAYYVNSNIYGGIGGAVLFTYSETQSSFTGKPSDGLPSGRYPVANRVPWCQEWPE